MPSSNRLADAAIITPYLTYRIIHHGQPTLIPPDSAGRVRKGKTKKPRPRPERRTDDEPRFNVGSPRPRSQPTNGRGRRPTRVNGRQGRRDDIDDINIPDYPPPSFLEAISTPVTMSSAVVWPSTAARETSRSTPAAPSPPHSLTPPQKAEYAPHRPDTASQSLVVNPPDSDSPTDDSSLEAIELDPNQTLWEEDRTFGLTLEARVGREYVRQVAQASTSSSSSHDVSRTIPSDSLCESRNRPSRGVLDSDPAADARNETQLASTRLKKRHLAPLRALSLSPSKLVSDRTLSARPSGSPYSFARSGSQFFRSTTSLCKITLSSSAPSSVGSESNVTRRLFPSKGKERVQDSPCIEPLDAWEMVDSDQPESPMDSPKSPKRFFFPRLATVPSFHRFHDQKTSTEPRSPSTDMRTHDSFIPASPTDCTPPRGEISSQPSPSFVHRQVRRAPPPPPPPRLTSFTPASSPPVSPISAPSSTYFSRTFPPTIAKPSSPPSSTKIQRYEISPTIVHFRGPDTGDLQATPILRHTQSDSIPTSPSDMLRNHVSESPMTPTSGTENRSHTICKLFSPSSHTEVQNCTPPPSPITQQSPERSRFQSIGVPPRWNSMSPLARNRALSPLSISEPGQTRHHYPGRPLPRPPPLVVAEANRVTADTRNVGNCPEGLLIDFEGALCFEGDKSAASPTLSVKNQPVYCDNLPGHTSPESFDYHSPHDALSPGDLRVQPDPFLTPAPLPHQLPTPAALDEAVNPDLITLRACSRSDPDTSSLVPVFTGQTSPQPHINNSVIGRVQGFLDTDSDSGRNRVDDHRLVSASGPSSSPPAGRIEVERRRVTEDGRVKLKLTLLGITVDRCGICLSQFKGGEWAGFGATCRHVFHERCLAHWMARSRTCPLCRLPWDYPLDQ